MNRPDPRAHSPCCRLYFSATVYFARQSQQMAQAKLPDCGQILSANTPPLGAPTGRKSFEQCHHSPVLATASSAHAWIIRGYGVEVPRIVLYPRTIRTRFLASISRSPYAILFLPDSHIFDPDKAVKIPPWSSFHDNVSLLCVLPPRQTYRYDKVTIIIQTEEIQ